MPYKAKRNNYENSGTEKNAFKAHAVLQNVLYAQNFNKNADTLLCFWMTLN